jgi:hypothetical protein
MILALDVWYVENWSLGLDLRILLTTVWRVLRRDGISQDGHPGSASCFSDLRFDTAGVSLLSAPLRVVNFMRLLISAPDVYSRRVAFSMRQPPMLSSKDGESMRPGTPIVADQCVRNNSSGCCPRAWTISRCLYQLA